VAVAQALDPAIKLREYSQDSGVKAVVALFADGYELDELVRAVRSLKTTPYWLEKKRGLSGLTIEVVRREIAALSANAPKPQRKADPSERRIVGEDQGVIFYSDGTQATKSALASAV
jgi:hypothetical protein